MRLNLKLVFVGVSLTMSAGSATAEVPDQEQQISGAVSAAPEDRRDGATVMGYSNGGDLKVLRKGSNELICLADKPGDDRFHATCYHDSLEAYMARGRELRAEGKEGPESLEIRHHEADDGKLEMPSTPATIYNLGGPAEIFDPATGEVSGGHWVWAVYIPYATEESTGLPTSPQAPGAPWIMRPGTASSHIMVVQPREAKP
jgi:hypothetical protein